MSVEFIYEPEFPREDVSVDDKKLSALNTVAHDCSWHFLGYQTECSNHFIESLKLLDIKSIDLAVEFHGELMKISYAIQKIGWHEGSVPTWDP